MSEIDLAAGTLRYSDEGSGRPFVFVHGVLANAALWSRVTPLIGNARKLTVDWPLGSHPSAMRAEADLTIGAVARLIAEFLDKLELEDVVLVGNDTGGALSQIVATEHGARVGAVVLTSCDAFDNFLPRMFRYLQMGARVPGFLWLAGQTMRADVLRRLPPAYGWLAKRVDAEILEGFASPMRRDRGIRRDLAKVLRDISPRYTEAAAEKLRDFDKPLVLAWSSEDRFFPVEHAHRLAALAPRARVELIEDAFTFSPLDNPNRLAEILSSLV